MKKINAADIKEFQKVKGIGKATAQKIVNYREDLGGFDSLEEIKNVSGIGKKNFAKLKDFIAKGDSNDKKIKKDLKQIKFNPDDYNIEKVEEVHLVGDMNNWNPADKTYSLKEQDGIWMNSFNLTEGTEYKIMYDSISWEANKHIGSEEDNNFIISN